MRTFRRGWVWKTKRRKYFCIKPKKPHAHFIQFNNATLDTVLYPIIWACCPIILSDEGEMMSM